MTIIGIICVAGGSFFLGLIVASALWKRLEKYEVKKGYIYLDGKYYRIEPLE